MKRSLTTKLKAVVLLFWSVWFSIVTLTNLFDFLRSHGILTTSWPMASGNYALLQKTTSVYHVASWINMLLFVGVITWEAVSAILFWHAAVQMIRYERFEGIVRPFVCGLALFAAFAISCEVFLSYEIESVHIGIFTALIVSVIAVRLLPES